MIQIIDFYEFVHDCCNTGERDFPVDNSKNQKRKIRGRPPLRLQRPPPCAMTVIAIRCLLLCCAECILRRSPNWYHAAACYETHVCRLRHWYMSSHASVNIYESTEVATHVQKKEEEHKRRFDHCILFFFLLQRGIQEKKRFKNLKMHGSSHRYWKSTGVARGRSFDFLSRTTRMAPGGELPSLFIARCSASFHSLSKCK